MARQFSPLFYVEKGNLIINVPELVLIPEFQALIKDRKTFKFTDYQYKVFAFIWFYSCYDSPHINLPRQERFNQSVIDARLDKNDPPFFPDDDEMKAVAKFEELEKERVPELEVLIELKRGLVATKDTVTLLTERVIKHHREIKNLTNQIDKAITDDMKNLAKANLETEMLALENSQNMLHGLSKTIPETIDKIEKMTDKVRKALAQKEQVRGGGDIGNREDPNG